MEANYFKFCTDFAIHQHESTMGVHMFPILNPLLPPSPYHLSGSSQCTSLKHPISCIEPRLIILFLYDNTHVSMPFSQIIPPSPSPTESKRLFYTSVSLLLSRIQGYHYHLSKFHIYALLYCIGVFLCHALLIIVFSFHFYSTLEMITLFYCSILFSTLVYSAMSIKFKSIWEKVDSIWFVLAMTGLKNNTMPLFLMININILVWEKSFMD